MKSDSTYPPSTISQLEQDDAVPTVADLPSDGISSLVEAAWQGAQQGIGQAVADVVTAAIAEAIEDLDRERQQLTAPYLRPDELIVDAVEVERKKPFLVRVMPFVPDLLIGPRRYLLVVTQQRLLILHLGRRWFRRDSDFVRSQVLAVRLEEIKDTRVRGGWSPRLYFRLSDGREYWFHTEAAEGIIKAIREAGQPAAN